MSCSVSLSKKRKKESFLNSVVTVSIPAHQVRYLSQQRLNTVLFLMAKAWQECNLPPESSLLSLKSSSQAQGWPAGPRAIS